MKIERYIMVTVVLMVGMFVVNASWPEVSLANGQASTNTWCVPATAGAGISGTFCSNTPAPLRSACREPAQPETLLDTIGSIVEAPFVAAQCILDRCP